MYITDVKWMLFLLSKLISIKSDNDMDVIFKGPSRFLKGILNA